MLAAIFVNGTFMCLFNLLTISIFMSDYMKSHGAILEIYMLGIYFTVVYKFIMERRMRKNLNNSTKTKRYYQILSNAIFQ